MKNTSIQAHLSEGNASRYQTGKRISVREPTGLQIILVFNLTQYLQSVHALCRW
jgi:hypothetical protein